MLEVHISFAPTSSFSEMFSVPKSHSDTRWLVLAYWVFGPTAGKGAVRRSAEAF